MHSRFSLFLLWVVTCIMVSPVAAEVHTDTIKSNQGDYITLTYDVVRSQNKFTVRFENPIKRLSKENAPKYKELSEVNVIFFDRTGNYEGYKVEGMMPRDIDIPAHCDYKGTKEGIFFIEQGCKDLVFSTESTRRISVKIPIYLARKERKNKLHLFADCGQLLIQVPEYKVDVRPDTHSTEHNVSRPTKSQEEIESEKLTARVENLLKLAQKSLDQATKLPFPRTLDGYIQQMQTELVNPDLDPRLAADIETLLEAYNAKEEELMEQQNAAASAASKAAADKAEEEKAEAERKAEEIRKEQEQKQEQEQKKQNLMWIIGLALAGTGFIGNQVWQTIRGKRNQEDMLKMQQQLAQKAEAEAKMKAQQALKQQAQNAKQQMQTAIRGGDVSNDSSSTQETSAPSAASKTSTTSARKTSGTIRKI